MKFNKKYEEVLEAFKPSPSMGDNYHGMGLKEMPEGVYGSRNKPFDIGDNKLTNLINGPTKVNGLYSANDNKLTSLEGAPKIAKGFSISNNPNLGNLEGISNNKYGHFSCSDCGLTNLLGLPKLQGNIFGKHVGSKALTLDVSNNYLESLEGLERNKRYSTINVGGTGFSQYDVQEYAEQFGLRIGQVLDGKRETYGRED